MCLHPQVMIDQNGDGRIEYNECLVAAKEALADEQLATNRSNVTVKEMLQRVSDFMRNNKVAAHIYDISLL